MRKVRWADGREVDALGLGTWRMGESGRERAREIAAVRRAFELGYRLIDTAEMYGEGGAEEVVGQALNDAIRAGDVRREEVFVVSKVYPHNASRRGTPAACERSRHRLRLECIDLYLLHWPGSHPLAETVEAFEALKAQGHIGHWGVSNFAPSAMADLWRIAKGPACRANQVCYSLTERGIEFDLLPWHHEHRVPVMAYCPIDQGRLSSSAALRQLAARHGHTAAQVALAWLLQRGNVIAIPKAVREEHLRENLAAADIVLGAAECAELDMLFPPPRSQQPLAVV